MRQKCIALFVVFSLAIPIPYAYSSRIIDVSWHGSNVPRAQGFDCQTAFAGDDAACGAPDERRPDAIRNERIGAGGGSRRGRAELQEGGGLMYPLSITIPLALVALGVVAVVWRAVRRARRRNAEPGIHLSGDAMERHLPSESRNEEPAAVREAPPVVSQETHGPPEIPWRLEEQPALPDSALTQRRTAEAENRKAALNGERSGGSAEEAGKPAAEEPAQVTPPGLSQLRGMLFSPAIRELDKMKHRAQHNAEFETLLRQIEPLEPLIESAGALKNPMPAPQAGPESAASTDASAAVSDRSAARAEERKKPEKSKARGNGGEDLRDVPTLPSKRGQYKRKG